MTSPVDFISGPSTTSTPGNLMNGKTDSFTTMWSGSRASTLAMALTRWPSIPPVLYRLACVIAEVLVVVDDLRSAAGKLVRRAPEHRIAERRRDTLGLVERACGRAGRLHQPQFVEESREALAVLGTVDGIGRGAQDRDARLLERDRQLQRRLAAELHDDAERPLLLDDVQHVLERERLEVETVGGVVVGGDRLLIAVDHDRFHAELFQREGRVNAAVVELDALADPVGTRAQDDDLLPAGRRRLVLLLVGRVEVRRVGGKLGGARVHGLERHRDAMTLADCAHGRLGRSGEGGDAPVGEAPLLGPAQQARIGQARPRDLGLELDDLADLLEEPGIDLRQRVDL